MKLVDFFPKLKYILQINITNNVSNIYNVSGDLSKASGNMNLIKKELNIFVKGKENKDEEKAIEKRDD